MRMERVMKMRYFAMALLSLDYCVAFYSFALVALSVILKMEASWYRSLLFMIPQALYLLFYAKRIIIAGEAERSASQGMRRVPLSWRMVRFAMIDVAYAAFHFAVIATLCVRMKEVVAASLWREVVVVAHVLVHAYMTYKSLRFDMQSGTFFPRVEGRGQSDRMVGASDEEMRQARAAKKAALMRFLKIYLIEIICLLLLAVAVASIKAMIRPGGK